MTVSTETLYTTTLFQVIIKDDERVAEFSFGYATEADPVRLRDAAQTLLAVADHLERIAE